MRDRKRMEEQLASDEELARRAGDIDAYFDLAREGEPVESELEKEIQSLNEYVVHLTDKLQFLLDADLGFISTEQNDLFKVLTIASVVGIPPVLVAGIYGMNFHNMPELSWPDGYPFGLALIVISGLLPLLWFKWKGWWE